MPPRLGIDAETQKAKLLFWNFGKTNFHCLLTAKLNWISFSHITIAQIHTQPRSTFCLFISFQNRKKITMSFAWMLFHCYTWSFFSVPYFAIASNLGKHKASSLSFFLRRKMVPFAKVDFKRRLAPQKTVRNYVFGTLATEKLETNAFFNCCLSSDAWDLLKCLSYIA